MVGHFGIESEANSSFLGLERKKKENQIWLPLEGVYRMERDRDKANRHKARHRHTHRHRPLFHHTSEGKALSPPMFLNTTRFYLVEPSEVR